MVRVQITLNIDHNPTYDNFNFQICLLFLEFHTNLTLSELGCIKNEGFY